MIQPTQYINSKTRDVKSVKKPILGYLPFLSPILQIWRFSSWSIMFYFRQKMLLPQSMRNLEHFKNANNIIMEYNFCKHASYMTANVLKITSPISTYEGLCSI